MPPKMICPYGCADEWDFVDEVHGTGSEPGEGDYGMCSKCGQFWNIINGEVTKYEPTIAEFDVAMEGFPASRARFDVANKARHRVARLLQSGKMKAVAMPRLDYKKQAAGAIPNGTRIVKQNSESGDCHHDGAIGKVVGSLGPDLVPETPHIHYMYLIEWEDLKGLVVGTADFKIKPLTEE